MNKLLIELFNILPFVAFLTFPVLNTRNRAITTFVAVAVQAIIASFIAVSVFINGAVNFSYAGSFTTGAIPVKVDFLSAWFILIISFGFVTGAWYGMKYMKSYIADKAGLALHSIAFLLAFTSLVDICITGNGIVFLVLWEIMALSSFILIIYENQKRDTLKAGINFLIQSHISILFLTIAFIVARVRTGTFDMSAIAAYTYSQPAVTGITLFLLFFVGFAIKAGFVPFHTWLPLAHPAAPAHISGVMSGVIIKIGIYGIMRTLLLIKSDMLIIGYIILSISVITGVYGVMLAIVQHNLKKLLAYHSIENIGIIGIGIGVGCIGVAYNNPLLIAGGFGGALLHTLNHSLFKSLLFYTAGNVYQATHTMDVEKLGGLIKKMPKTAFLFLIASLAICGLPPFNGFVSEFFIYSGLFHGLLSNHFLFILFILFSILGLVLIGGLALICFTKAFGVVFLGTPRSRIEDIQLKEDTGRMGPLYIIAGLILLIGLFPTLFTSVLSNAVALYSGSGSSLHVYQSVEGVTGILTSVGRYSLIFVLLTLVVFAIRRLLTANRTIAEESTWGCGYTGDAGKMQYTASSFIRTYRKLAEPVLLVKRHKHEPGLLYPEKVYQETHPYDKVEKWLIDKPLHLMRKFLNRFVFLQNGNIQAYILYGFIFIGLTVIVPVLYDKVIELIQFINQW
jgi:formate hydrogenlyase subunit 3/multisubunit Na+/H+ antiporter MnhD subunit